jgi:hypothetical protein
MIGRGAEQDLVARGRGEGDRLETGKRTGRGQGGRSSGDEGSFATTR